MTTKKAKLFATFDNPDDWLTNNITIEDGYARLKAEKRLIYASDLDPTPPIVQHTFNYGGEQITRYFINPPDTSEMIFYTYEIAPELPIEDRRFLGDHCLYQFAALSVDETTSVAGSIAGLYPRRNADDFLFFGIELGYTASVKKFYLAGNESEAHSWLYRASQGRPTYRKLNKISIFRVWVVGHAIFKIEAQGQGGFCNASGGVVDKSFTSVSSSNPQGAFRVGPNWATDTIYFGSPGGEHNSGDPAVLQLWPIKQGWVFPKNEKELYITVTEEMLEKVQAGEAEVYVPNQGKWMTSFVLSDYIESVIPVSGGNFYIFTLVEDWKLNWHPFLTGGLIFFPEVEGASPLRIFSTEIGIGVHNWNIPDDLLVPDRRVELHACSVVPCATPYPIPEEGPSMIIPLDFNGNLMNYRGFATGEIEPGTKYTFGFLLCNLPDPTIDVEISELTIIQNPASDTTIGYWPVNIEFEFERDDTEPASHRVQVWSEDDEGFKKTLEWTASTEASWIELSKTSGTSDGPPDSFDITVDPTNLQPGTYSTTVNVEGAGDVKQVQVIATKKKKLSIVAREKPVVVKR